LLLLLLLLLRHGSSISCPRLLNFSSALSGLMPVFSIVKSLTVFWYLWVLFPATSPLAVCC
jgi:hypothetical protein